MILFINNIGSSDYLSGDVLLTSGYGIDTVNIFEDEKTYSSIYDIFNSNYAMIE